MKKMPLLGFYVLCQLVCATHTQAEPASADVLAEIALMKAEVGELRNAVARLEKEVNDLKSELQRDSSTSSFISSSSKSDTNHSGKATKTGYWCTKSGKRHNSSCRYYKSTNGRPCGHQEGTPCNICGG